MHGITQRIPGAGHSLPRCCSPTPSTPTPSPFLRLVHQGHRVPHGKHGKRWPTWQWVRWQADQLELDAEAVLRRLPTWQHHYRAFRTDELGGSFVLAKPIELTVRGLAAVGDTELVPVFLAALAAGAEHQASVEPDPHAMLPATLRALELVNRVELRSGRQALQWEPLRTMLLREPPTWSGHFADASTWVWDVTNAPLRSFVGVSTVEDYLERLDDLIGVRRPALTSAPVPPLALFDALDHLDAEWTVRTGQRLLQAHRLTRPAQLSQPVTSAAEFEAACSALDDLLKQMRPQPSPAQPDEGTLAQLDRRLSQLLPKEVAARTADALGVLRRVNALRVGQQHSGSKPYQRQQRARRELGLADSPGDWSGDWQRLQHALLDALRVLRDAVAAPAAGTP